MALPRRPVQWRSSLLWLAFTLGRGWDFNWCGWVDWVDVIWPSVAWMKRKRDLEATNLFTSCRPADWPRYGMENVVVVKICRNADVSLWYTKFILVDVVDLAGYGNASFPSQARWMERLPIGWLIDTILSSIPNACCLWWRSCSGWHIRMLRDALIGTRRGAGLWKWVDLGAIRLDDISSPRGMHGEVGAGKWGRMGWALLIRDTFILTLWSSLSKMRQSVPRRRPQKPLSTQYRQRTEENFRKKKSLGLGDGDAVHEKNHTPTALEIYNQWGLPSLTEMVPLVCT